jgi:hypothetical protein
MFCAGQNPPGQSVRGFFSHSHLLVASANSDGRVFVWKLNDEIVDMCLKSIRERVPPKKEYLIYLQLAGPSIEGLLWAGFDGQLLLLLTKRYKFLRVAF